MMYLQQKYDCDFWVKVILSTFLLAFLSFPAKSQMTVYPVQDFNFGTFYQGSSGGSVEITPSGSRSASGDIVLMNMGVSYSQAIFEIEAPSGTLVSVSMSPDVTLSGSNGGSITLKLGSLEPEFPLITAVSPPGRTQVKIGGALIVGNRNDSPAGNYTGSFSITFHQE
ncbi:DUF4402 domain-containing protein [Paradesertivirga mongoliensis]|uniref:DUF4402 domain-containing protein n=1 Tax=Paradesertivirga mongoliensis TaxID=2100740 RepID=A0ABW4ZMF3_9SPHI|nr:DUF4402 domain-containing protein [Pedobacter mongoliensis]